MEPSVQRLQFLDLTDASENDQSLIERVLFSSNQTLEVPWFTGRTCAVTPVRQPVEPEWIPSTYNNIDAPHNLQASHIPEHQADVDGGEEQCIREEEQIADEQNHHGQGQQPRPGGIYTGHPPTSLPHQQPIFQMYHPQLVPSMSNVYVSNVTANVNVHPSYVSPLPHYGPQMPPPQQPQVFPPAPPEGEQSNRGRRPRQQKDKKQNGAYIPANDVMSPPIENHPPPQFPNIHPMPPYYITGAAGAPLYTTVVPLYPAMFNPYSPPPGGLMYPQANGMQHGSEEYHENVQQSYPPPAADMVVVGGVMRQENEAEHRGPEGNDSNCYQVEEQMPESFQGDQRLPDPEYKPAGNDNIHYAPEIVNESDHVPPAVPQQNGEHFPGDVIEEKYGDSNVIETVIIKNHYYDQKLQPAPLSSQQPQQDTMEMENLNQTGELNQTQITMAEPKFTCSSDTNKNVDQSCNESDILLNMLRKKLNKDTEVNNDVNSVDNKCVNSHLNSTAGRIAYEKEAPSATPNDLSESNKTSINNSVQDVQMTSVQQGSPVPVSQSNDFPMIGQNAKSSRNTVESSAKTDAKSEPPSAQQNQPAAPNTWASLFHTKDQHISSPAVDNKSRPMARVLPYHDTGNCNSVTGLPVAPSTPSAVKAERLTSPKSNGAVAKKPVPIPTLIHNDPYLHEIGEFLCNYELDHRILSLQPRGLTNRSNWCYINAIMQSLIVCPAFYNLLKALPVKMKRRGGNQTLIMDALVDFVNEFNPVPSNARIGKREKSARNKDEGTSVEIAAGPAFEPSGIYKVLHKIRGEGSFNIEGRQEDAEEFLSCLLNGLNDEMFELMKMVDSNKTHMTNGESNGAIDGDAEDDEAEWNVMGPKNKSSVTRRAVCGKTPLSDIFRGQVRSRVQRAGDQSTDTVQPFFTLQLDVEKANSVKDALELLVGRDTLEGVTCTRTNQEVEAWTQMSLEDLPLVLILHLKCFDYKPDGCSKIMKPVNFSVDLKVDAKLLSNRNKYQPKQRSYKLVAVVYHDGKEASKGHYVTDAYHVGYGCWVRYDDGVVRSVPEAQVLKPRLPRVPYLLYYRRTDTIGTTK